MKHLALVALLLLCSCSTTRPGIVEVPDHVCEGETITLVVTGSPNVSTTTVVDVSDSNFHELVEVLLDENGNGAAAYTVPAGRPLLRVRVPGCKDATVMVVPAAK